MKMIEVLQKLANGEIKDQTILEIHDPHVMHTYTFEVKYNSFYSNTKYRRELGGYFKISGDFLNYEVELIPPKEKEYLVKFNMRGLDKYFRYMNYVKKYEYVKVGDKVQTASHQTRFTKQELQSIQPVREFLDDMQGKYELIEVEDNEID